MELIISMSNWSHFFINIIEIYFLSFFWKRKFFRCDDEKCIYFLIRGI